MNAHIYFINIYIYIYLCAYDIYMNMSISIYPCSSHLKWLPSDPKFVCRVCHGRSSHRSKNGLFGDGRQMPVIERPWLIDKNTLSPDTKLLLWENNWLVVYRAPLKNISQLGSLFPMYGKLVNVPNHQPDSVVICFVIICYDDSIQSCSFEWRGKIVCQAVA